MAGTSKGPMIRVLVVDDSALIRAMLHRALQNHPRIEVIGEAENGIDAIKKIAALRPDVVTLDVEMPQMNGIGVLERAAGKVPVSFVMVSTLTESGGRITLEALQKGAFDYVTKPSATDVRDAEFQDAVIRKVLAASLAKGKSRQILRPPGQNAPKIPPNKVTGWVVTIGISCGGPQTLTEMLPAFPSDFVPIIITQHMPAQFTKAFASQLDAVAAMRVKEAADGDKLENGMVYVAPGSHHLTLRRSGVKMTIKLDDGPKVSGHRPSADVMFRSVAEQCGGRAVGVIMTGMGRDGADGIVAMHESGIQTVGQDEQTSLVYGMPKVAAETGHLDHVVPLHQIPQAINRLLKSGNPAAAGV